MTTEPLSARAERLGSIQRALSGPGRYEEAFERAEGVTLALAGSVEAQLRATPDLAAELLAVPLAEREALVGSDARFHSAPLAAVLLDEAREHPELGEELLLTACLVLHRVNTEYGKPLQVCAQALLAEVERQRGDWEAAEKHLVTAAEDLHDWSVSFDRAVYCVAVANLRRDQGRWDEAVAIRRRAGEIYEALEEGVEAAEVFLGLGDWCMAIGSVREASSSYAAALLQELSPGQALAATRGLAYTFALRGKPDMALDVIRATRRELAPASYEALVLGLLEGQMLLLRDAERAVRQGRRELRRAFEGLLRLGKQSEALQAGLALLLSDARGGAKVAAQILGFVPASWPGVREALAEVKATGHLPAGRRAIVHRYLATAGGHHGA